MSEVISQKGTHFQQLGAEVGKVVIGQHEPIMFMLLAILCEGHILLEGVPGIAKTTMIKALAKAMGLPISVYNSLLIYCLPILLEHLYIIQKRKILKQKKGLFLPTLFLPTKSIVPLPKCKRLFLKQCKSNKLL